MNNLKRPNLANLEAEQGVVGAILLESDAIDRVMDMVSPEDFTSEPIQLVYQQLVDMRLSGEPIDLVTVTAKLFETGHIDRVGGPGFLASLSDNVGSARYIEFWVAS